MVRYKKLGLVLGAVAMLALLPAKADAQFIRYSPIFWSFDVNAGVELPMSDLSDVAKPGFTVGAGWSYFLNPRFDIRIDEAATGYGILQKRYNHCRQQIIPCKVSRADKSDGFVFCGHLRDHAQLCH